MNHLPIGLFDSGMGGLTVMREVADLLPNERLIYLGDTARLPYGNKSPEAILQYSLDNARFLLEQEIKLLIIACHTACSHALTAVAEALPIPVIGVTESGFQAAIQATQNDAVAILGTRATIASGIFQSLLLEERIAVHPIACPLFVPLVEEGLLHHPATKLIIEHYLSPLKKTNVDTALLACTHYPLLKSGIQEFLGPTIQLIEPARATAISARELLKAKDLLNPTKITHPHQFYASDDPEKFRHLAPLFFSHPIERVYFRPCQK